MSRSCQNLDQDLLLALHGELPLARRVRVRLHLTKCRACRRRQAALAEVSAAVRSAVREAGPYAVADYSLLARPSARRFARPAYVLAFALLMAFAAGYAVFTNVLSEAEPTPAAAVSNAACETSEATPKESDRKPKRAGRRIGKSLTPQ